MSLPAHLDKAANCKLFITTSKPKDLLGSAPKYPYFKRDTGNDQAQMDPGSSSTHPAVQLDTQTSSCVQGNLTTLGLGFGSPRLARRSSWKKGKGKEDLEGTQRDWYIFIHSKQVSWSCCLCFMRQAKVIISPMKKQEPYDHYDPRVLGCGPRRNPSSYKVGHQSSGNQGTCSRSHGQYQQSKAWPAGPTPAVLSGLSQIQLPTIKRSLKDQGFPDDLI